MSNDVLIPGDTIEAAMARIKALQDMLNNPQAAEEEEEYDPNDPNQQYQETEDDEKWREEQEKEWERQQAIEREAAAKAKAEAAANPPAAATAAASTPAAASTAAAASATAAKPAVASSSSSAPAASAASATATGPHQWSTAQLVSWLKTVKDEVKKRAEIFERKGWTKDEITKWTGEVESAFTVAAAKMESTKLTGATVATWDIKTDAAWGTNLGVTSAYHRAAMWASWKAALRQFQSTHK